MGEWIQRRMESEGASIWIASGMHPRVERHTPVKTIPSPQLRLRGVNKGNKRKDVVARNANFVLLVI